MAETNFPIVIHHNPDCGTSRNTVAFIQAAEYQPTVIEYLKEGWTRPQLLGLFAAMGVGARACLRTTKVPDEALALANAAEEDEALIAAMIKFPILVNRPIVVTPLGVRLCRPSEEVFALLERLPNGPLKKEDGDLVIDESGRLVG